MLTPRLVTLTCLAFAAASCGHSPRTYIEAGDRYFTEHKYRDASIQYRKAIQKDPKFGEAVYRLALSELEQKNVREGYGFLLRAVDLMPANQEAKGKLADLCFAIFWADPRRPKVFYDRAAQIAEELLAKDPKSFEGLRLKGVQAMLDRQPKVAVDYYTRANLVRPMQANLVPELVQALAASGEGQSAERLARDFIGREPSSGPIYGVLYNQYLHENRAADAEEVLKTQIRNRPADAESRLQLARHYAREGKPEQMRAILEGLIQDPKTFPNGRLQVADFYSQLGDWRDSLEQYEQGAKLNSPDQLSYEKGAVNALVALGKREDALKQLDALVKKYPKNRELKIVQSSLWLLSREPDRIQAAISQLDELTKQDPEDISPRFGLAQGYRLQGQLDSARKQYQEILKRQPQSPEARLGLADVALAQKKPEEALRYADDMLTVNPEGRLARLLRSNALAAMGDYVQARQDLNRILSASPQDRDAQIQAGTLAIMEKRYKDAEAIFTKLRYDGAQDIRLATGLVNAYVADNNYDRAIQILNEDLRRSPKSSELRLLLATTATGAGRYDMALEEYGRLVAQQPNSPQLYTRIARLRQLKGDSAGALSAAEKAKQLSPKDAGAVGLVAELLYRAGRLEEAKANYQQLVQIEPDNGEALNNLAFLIADTGGDLDEAQRLAQHAQQKYPAVADYADTLGWIYLKRKQHDSAIQVFTGVVKKAPENSTYRYHLGLALWQTGQKERARAELQTALTKRPAKDEEAKIRDAIARLG